MVQLERIPEAYRIPIHHLERERAEAVPKLLGSLLSALAMGLNRVESLHLERLPRMADFALMATACEPGLGLQDGEFMRAYQANIDTAVETAVECNPIAAAILTLMEDCTQWEGSTQDLLDKMKHKSSSTKVLKLDPRRLGHAMRGSLKADLDALGIEVDDYKTKTGKRWIIKRLETPSKVGKTSSPSSPLALCKALTGDNVESPPNIVTTSSPLKPYQGKENDDDDDKNETLQGSMELYVGRTREPKRARARHSTFYLGLWGLLWAEGLQMGVDDDFTAASKAHHRRRALRAAELIRQSL
ncbi:MAG: hypothetical protein HC924_15600 [Synechococcaceae cyanobacterium SM2_3_2]|nr:hypothetical protein [Synechococcaceae cyanobacterium SM2_3_2]